MTSATPLLAGATHAARPDGAMPPTGVGAQDVRDVAAYLYSRP